jgi:hypothetical protein
MVSAALVAVLLAIPPCHAACPLERAHYSLRGAPTVTARFREIGKYPGWITNVALQIDFQKEGDHFWWLFDEGSARYLNMISTTDIDKAGWQPPSEQNNGRRPLGEKHVWFADGAYNLNYNAPKSGDVAPAHIFIPDFEEAMWYEVEPRRGVPTAFFDLIRCP